MAVELRHVRVFLALAEELHFGRTARRLRVAQSAVSQTIQALEREVGAELFARTPKVSLTAAGGEFAICARRSLAELERGCAAARVASTGEGGRLSVSLGPIVALAGVARMIARFQRASPRVELELQAWSSADQLSALTDGRTDVAFVHAAKHDLGGLAHQVLERVPIVAVLPKGHRLSTRPSISFRELSGERLLVLDDTGDGRVRAQVAEQCRLHAFEPTQVVGVPQLEGLLALVAARMGISFAPAIVGHARFPGVLVVPVRPSVTSAVVMAWNEDRLPATGKRLIAFAGKVTAEPRRGR
jgi:DNA-binding transcriptional LysR family regulator